MKETVKKANKKLKSIATGASVAALNLGLTATVAQQCTGSCQTCGGLCVIPVVGLIAGGVVAYTVKLYQGKEKNLLVPQNKESDNILGENDSNSNTDRDKLSQVKR